MDSLSLFLASSTIVVDVVVFKEDVQSISLIQSVLNTSMASSSVRVKQNHTRAMRLLFDVISPSLSFFPRLPVTVDACHAWLCLWPWHLAPTIWIPWNLERRASQTKQKWKYPIVWCEPLFVRSTGEWASSVIEWGFVTKLSPHLRVHYTAVYG